MIKHTYPLINQMWLICEYASGGACSIYLSWVYTESQNNWKFPLGIIHHQETHILPFQDTKFHFMKLKLHSKPICAPFAWNTDGHEDHFLMLYSDISINRPTCDQVRSEGFCSIITVRSLPCLHISESLLLRGIHNFPLSCVFCPVFFWTPVLSLYW